MARADTRAPLGLVLWLGLAAIWMTLAPFEPRGEWHPSLQLLLQPEVGTVGHFFLLMPFGVIAAAYFRNGDHRWNWRPAAAVASFGLLLEVGQRWVAGRTLSPYDVLFGYLGAVLAMGVTERFLRRGASAESVHRTLAAAAIVLVWTLMVHGAVVQNHGLRLAGWTAAFPVLEAQEAGGSRPYVGTVEDAIICAGAAFDVCVEPGADAESRAQLSRVAMDSQSVRLTAQVVSETDGQTGPARIVTFSDGAYVRNVTLAQRTRNLILRVRTTRGGPNGTAFQFVLRDALREHQPTQVAATFARGVVTLRAGSGETVAAGTYRPPFRNSLRAQGSARPRLFQPLLGHGPLVGTVVQFLGLGLTLGYLVPSRKVRLILAPALAMAFLWTLDTGLEHTMSPTLTDYALAAGAAAVAAWTRRGHLSTG